MEFQSQPNDQAIQALREALKLTPDNLPLRQHLGDLLLGLGRHAEAELEFRQGLSLYPGDVSFKFGLARAFYQQAKHSHALVVLEDIAKSPHPPPRARVLYARLLAQAGDVSQAVEQYKAAVAEDVMAADLELADRLGIGAQQDAEISDGRVRAGWEEPAAPSEVEVERPKINFASVGGMDTLKEEIRMKIIYPLQHADLFKAYGKSVGGGILMYGPPGCGKTHLARATAGEIKAGFISVGISDVLDMWMGNSEKNLHEVFDRARRCRPCVLFFDEVDALGANRHDLRQSAGRQLINQFLSEMDGIQSVNDGVLILAATNAPWHLDPAFRRPGRFDRVLFVPPPDAPARSAILQIQLQGKPAAEVDCEAIAKKTDAFSGADLKAVVDQAIESKLREAMKAGIPKPLSTKDLLQTAGTVKSTTREWFATARNFALYANQGGIYDDILKFMKM
jgi:ATP-dependent 26S proteasome regulatory subunit